MPDRVNTIAHIEYQNANPQVCFGMRKFLNKKPDAKANRGYYCCQYYYKGGAELQFLADRKYHLLIKEVEYQGELRNE